MGKEEALESEGRSQMGGFVGYVERIRLESGVEGSGSGSRRRIRRRELWERLGNWREESNCRQMGGLGWDTFEKRIMGGRRGLWKVEGGAQWEDWDTLVIQGGGGWHQGQRDGSRRTKLRNRLGGGEHCQK